MLDKIKLFLTDEEKIDRVIWCVGYVVIGWILDILSWLASKTKTPVDDEAVKVVKEKVKQVKKNKKK